MILLQTPRRASDLHNHFELAPFLFLRNVDFEKDIFHSFSSQFYSTLIFLTKVFLLLWLFLLSLPFILKDQCASRVSFAASVKEHITKPFTLSSIFFSFFKVFFLTQQTLKINKKKETSIFPSTSSVTRKKINALKIKNASLFSCYAA